MSNNANNKASKNYTYIGTCWKCNEFSYLAKECKNITSNTSQSDHTTHKQTMINTYRDAHSTTPISQIKYPITISPTKSSILNQQITAVFQLSKEAWNQLSNQMNEMFEFNKLSKKAVQGTYKNSQTCRNRIPKSFKHKGNYNKIRKGT